MTGFKFPNPRFITIIYEGTSVDTVYRIDDRSLQKKDFYPKASERYIYDGGKGTSDIILDILSGSKFVIDMPWMITVNMRYEFDISDLKEIIKPVREACNW